MTSGGGSAKLGKSVAAGRRLAKEEEGGSILLKLQPARFVCFCDCAIKGERGSNGEKLKCGAAWRPQEVESQLPGRCKWLCAMQGFGERKGKGRVMRDCARRKDAQATSRHHDLSIC